MFFCFDNFDAIRLNFKVVLFNWDSIYFIRNYSKPNYLYIESFELSKKKEAITFLKPNIFKDIQETDFKLLVE